MLPNIIYDRDQNAAINILRKSIGNEKFSLKNRNYRGTHGKLRLWRECKTQGAVLREARIPLALAGGSVNCLSK